MSHSLKPLFNLTVCGVFAFATLFAQAKSTGKMDVTPGIYKIKSGGTLPIKGPIVEVYAEGASTKAAIRYSK